MSRRTQIMTSELYAALIAAAVAIVGAVASYVVNYLKNKEIRNRLKSLEDFFSSDDAEYYIECPNCKAKIVLNKVKIFVDKQDK